MAIQKYREALKIRTKKELPINYAETKMNLGFAYGILSNKSNKKRNLNKAIKEFIESLSIFSEKVSPINYSILHYHLGLIFVEMSQLKEKKKYCDLAQESFLNALKYSIQHSKQFHDNVKTKYKEIKEFCS